MPDGSAGVTMGILGTHNDLPLFSARALGGLWQAPGAGSFIVMHLAIVGLIVALTVILAGPLFRTRYGPAFPRRRGLSRLFDGRRVARFGLKGFIAKYLWQSSTMMAVALLVTLGCSKPRDVTQQRIAVMALGLSWGLYMLRGWDWCETVEHGCLAPLTRSSAMGMGGVRLRLWAAITIFRRASLHFPSPSVRW